MIKIPEGRRCSSLLNQQEVCRHFQWSSRFRTLSEVQRPGVRWSWRLKWGHRAAVQHLILLQWSYPQPHWKHVNSVECCRGFARHFCQILYCTMANLHFLKMYFSYIIKAYAHHVRTPVTNFPLAAKPSSMKVRAKRDSNVQLKKHQVSRFWARKSQNSLKATV